MKRKFPWVLLSAIMISACSHKTVDLAEWTLSYDRGIRITHHGNIIDSCIKAEYALGRDTVSSDRYARHKIRKTHINDIHGKGTQWTITYLDERMPELQHTFKIYPEFVLTHITVNDSNGVAADYMSPAVMNSPGEIISGNGLRAVFVPYDNDAWIRFRSDTTAHDTLRSYEVTAMYNPESRRGIIMGAIEHNRWKNAVDIYPERKKVKIFSGVADGLTRDSKGHGTVKGKSIRSAEIMIGCFNDWREGMETYAQTNTAIAPRRTWNKAVPVGWNSWGALQFGINHKNATEVVDFFTQDLKPQSFHNTDTLIYTGLDSGWDSFSEKQLKDFADRCSEAGQVPCIYWTPFTDWAKDPERNVPGTEGCRYRDIYLYANGKPQELDGARAIDPTHPAVRRMMENTAALFRRCGYKYVKMDFMTHGRMEADSWHDRNIHTGTEAYNHGMHLLDSIFGDMYINLSISPIFPAQYAQSRRIACDAWNKIKDTEYTMNALSWGWWTSMIYSFCDADHVVLRDATEGENRARITSAVITGMLITGDDFSLNGDSTAKARAMKFLTNKDIIKIADGRAFRPLHGNNDNSEQIFVRSERNGDVYLAVFNYTEKTVSFALPLTSMPLDIHSEYDIKELWSGMIADKNSTINIAPADAMIFLFRKR